MTGICDVCEKESDRLVPLVVYGIETLACPKCRHVEEDEEGE